jgi:D-glycero-D-manno-heptose 1,7-bisphosphate phosphatase
VSRSRFVILDRDGVINRDTVDYIRSPEEWIPLPGALEAIARLTAGGWTIAVATNQSGVGRGLFSEQMLGRIHAHMLAAVEAAGGRIGGVYYCPHAPDAGCACRKPEPGLLRQAADALGQRLQGAPYIGDKLTDIQAAIAAGARPVLVGPLRDHVVVPGLDLERYPDLAAAADALLADTARR